MLKKYKNWLLNAPIMKKIMPMQQINMLVIAFISVFSMLAVYKVNTVSQDMYSNSIKNQQIIGSIRSNLYRSRIVSRDIIIEYQDIDAVAKYYARLHILFDQIDDEMDLYLNRLPLERQERFRTTITEKNIYKDYIFKLADTIVVYNKHNAAIGMLDEIKKVSEIFYSELNIFIDEEIKFMDDAMASNTLSSHRVYIGVSFLCIVSLVFIYFSVLYSVEFIVRHVLGLTQSIADLIDSSNMKKEISGKYFTDDEIGFMAKTINKLKNMLLDYSNKDFLTGGYNASAYRNDLDEYFVDTNSKKRFWLIIFDMNNLKTINDNFGHIAGDNAIVQAHTILSKTFIEFGNVYRVGGDEFVSILNDCDEEQIQSLIKKMEEQIQEISTDEKSSFSIASAYGEFVGKLREEYDAFYLKVDMKMYRNKEDMKSSRTEMRGYR